MMISNQDDSLIIHHPQDTKQLILYVDSQSVAAAQRQLSFHYRVSDLGGGVRCFDEPEVIRSQIRDKHAITLNCLDSLEHVLLLLCDSGMITREMAVKIASLPTEQALQARADARCIGLGDDRKRVMT